MSFARLPRTMRTASFGLAIAYSLLFAGSVMILGGVVYLTVQSSLNRQMATRIDAEIDLLTEELRSEGPKELVREVRERTSYFHALDYLVLDAKGNRLAGNLPTMPPTAGWSDTSTSVGTHGGAPREFRVRSIVLDDGLRLAVGDDLEPNNEIREAFLEALGWGLLAFLLLSMTGGILLSIAFLRRVDAIRQTAEAIIGGELHSRVPLRGTNDNFDRLSDTLNRMLDRIQVLMETLGQVSNDIAHALRTPLGRLRQKLETARVSAKPNSKCEIAIDAAVVETENLLDTFAALLRIAQLEAATRSAGFREVDLSKLFEAVTDAYSAAAEDQGKAISAKIAPSVMAWGDKDLLTEMLANLLDNAITHTPSGAHIEVSLVNGGTRAVASVADDGFGVPRAERERIFRRFYRLERSIRTPGNGLGLSLVAAVAELHGVTLTAEDNDPGLRMTMIFDALPCDRVIQGRGELANGG
jgi:signal transduction histidine kinase